VLTKPLIVRPERSALFEGRAAGDEPGVRQPNSGELKGGDVARRDRLQPLPSFLGTGRLGHCFLPFTSLPGVSTYPRRALTRYPSSRTWTLMLWYLPSAMCAGM
jgi:hypothetical protein